MNLNNKIKVTLFLIINLFILLIAIRIDIKYNIHKEDIIVTCINRINVTSEIDTLFIEYELKADIYLSRDIFKNSPINAKILTTVAKKVYLETNKIVPLELVLAQCQFESGMGTTGRSPINNPFNVGEWDDITKLTFNSTEEGIESYMKLIINNYMKCKTVDELLINFVNCNNYRYASSKYENMIHPQYKFIKKFIKKHYLV